MEPVSIKDNKLLDTQLAEIDRHEEFVAADFYMWNLNLESSLRIMFLLSLGSNSDIFFQQK